MAFGLYLVIPKEDNVLSNLLSNDDSIYRTTSLYNSLVKIPKPDGETFPASPGIKKLIEKAPEGNEIYETDSMTVKGFITYFLPASNESLAVAKLTYIYCYNQTVYNNGVPSPGESAIQ